MSITTMILGFWLIPSLVTFALLVLTTWKVDNLPISKWNCLEWIAHVSLAAFYLAGLIAVVQINLEHWDKKRGGVLSYWLERKKRGY